MEQQFIKRMTEVEMGPVAKIFAERDDLVRKGANAANINDSALAGAGKELAKEQTEADKQNRQMQLKGAEYEAKQWDEVYKNLERNNAETIKRFKEMAQTQREILDIGVASERGMIASESTRAGRMSQLRYSGPGQEGDAIAATYLERVDLAQKLHTFEMDRASKELDLNKQKVDQAHAEADLRKGMYEAGVDAELKIAELQKRRTDELAKTSTALWNTLLTKPGDFGKQLSGTIHAAVLKPVTEGLGNLTANALKPVIYGADGMGGVAGLFGGMLRAPGPDQDRHRPEHSGDAPELPAMYMLSALLARASGVSSRPWPLRRSFRAWERFRDSPKAA